MAKNTSATGNDPIKNPLLRGKAAPASIVIATWAISMAALVGAYYVIVFFMSGQVVPLTMGLVLASTGVTADMPIETVLSAWVIPALFLVALEFVFVLLLMRTLWRLRRKALAALSRRVLGVEPSEESGEVSRAATALTSKTTRKQSTNTTKAA